MQLIKDNEIEYFTHETLKQQQEIMLELLSEFTQICKENNIRYWIDGGSLLGFARCGSLIPWDDDIDICVPINDYKKLEEVISSKSKGNYLFYKENNIKSWCEYYCSRDFSYKRRDGFIKPVKIDIFPIKNIPKNKVNFDVSYVDEISRYIKGSKDCFNNINMVDAIKDKKQKLEEYWDYMYSMKDETSDFLIKGHGQYSPIKCISRDVVFPLKKAEFCGVEVYIPQNLDAYLSKSYGGGYLNLPKLEKRKPVNLGLVDTSYIKEISEKEKIFTKAEYESFYYYSVGNIRLEKLKTLVSIFGFSRTLFNLIKITMERK